MIDLNKAFFKETNERLDIDPSKLCTYGIEVLDQALKGIFPNDLIVIGADSGVGKSEMAITIARENASKGKKVALFYLEGGEKEVVQRMKWRDMTHEYFTNIRLYEPVEMDYSKWIMNKIKSPTLAKLELKVSEQWQEKYKDNFWIHELKDRFVIEDLVASLHDFYNPEILVGKNNEVTQLSSFDVDLIIIDHLQYFSLPEKESEISAITRILKEVKRITNHYNIPIILISHLKKKDKDRGLPDQEDFYGTSNIPKISSCSITIAPCYGVEDLTKDIYPTFFRIVKSRVGVRSNLGFLVNFESRRRTYASSYQVFKLDKSGNPMKEPLKSNELPRWAKMTPETTKEDWEE